ncbi:MAG TPA: FtsX-like permease family protein [Anaerovoracaceae bacterium]|nr:FtsX-like permease family protein [Anaerovoracaceae bacterium]
MVKNRFGLSKIDTMLARMIGYSKGQFIAVLTIIVLGIAIYTAMNMTSVNMYNTVDTYYKENNFADLFLQTAAVPSQEAERLTDIDGVKQAMGRVTMDVPMITDNENERVNLRLITTTGEEDELSRSTILEGKMISGSGNEALLIEEFAKARGINIGDEIRIQAGGVQRTLEVTGIAANPEYIYVMENTQSIMPDAENFGVCYVSEQFGQQTAGLSGSYNEILISYEDDADEEALIDDVENALDVYGVKQIIKQKDQLSNSVISQELTQLDAMANSLPILFVLVAGLILMMMLSRLVKKDRIKIGILKAIGYSNRQVLFHYVKYALISGILGGAAGSILGMALAGGMTRLYLDFFHIPLLRIEFYYSYLAYAILLSAVFCTVSGLIGARGALKIAISEAMRAESPKLGKRILLEKIPFFWKRLSFSSKMISKNIFRNKKRTIFVLVGITLTYAMMLFTATMPDIMDRMMNEHFTEFQKMDYTIGFRTPVPKDTVRDMEHLIDVDYIEGKLEYPFELTNGNKKQSVSIIGLDKDTEFYTFYNSIGVKTEIPKNGMLITENLAKALEVGKGDLIQVKSYIPNRDDVYIQVKDVIKQTLGMNAYMDIRAMGETLLEKNVINGVYADSKDPDINEKLIRAANVASIMSVADTRAVYDEYMTMTNLSMGTMVLFAGILGFCIVYNATIVSLGEREMEFSSLRVLGFSKMEIFFMIVRENNIITILGILLGIPVGNVFAKYSSAAFSTDIYTIDMTPTLNAMIMACAYTVVFVLLAQLATYRKIKKLDFLQALKNRES